MLATAVKHAAKLISKAKLPLYGGLATDVEGMRAVLALAERSGGVVDHALSEGAIPQLQDRAVDRLDHVDPDRGAQSRRSPHHRRQRHP